MREAGVLAALSKRSLLPVRSPPTRQPPPSKDSPARPWSVARRTSRAPVSASRGLWCVHSTSARQGPHACAALSVVPWMRARFTLITVEKVGSTAIRSSMRLSNATRLTVVPPLRQRSAASTPRERSGCRVGLPEKPNCSGKYRSLNDGARNAVPAAALMRHSGVNAQPAPTRPVVWLPNWELWSVRSDPSSCTVSIVCCAAANSDDTVRSVCVYAVSLVTRSRRHSAPRLNAVAPNVRSFCHSAWSWSVSKVLGNAPLVVEWSLPRASRAVLSQLLVKRSSLCNETVPRRWWLTSSLAGPASKCVLALLTVPRRLTRWP